VPACLPAMVKRPRAVYAAASGLCVCLCPAQHWLACRGCPTNPLTVSCATVVAIAYRWCMSSLLSSTSSARSLYVSRPQFSIAPAAKLGMATRSTFGSGKETCSWVQQKPGSRRDGRETVSTGARVLSSCACL
jgi:hypothetical protein